MRNILLQPHFLYHLLCIIRFITGYNNCNPDRQYGVLTHIDDFKGFLTS